MTLAAIETAAEALALWFLFSFALALLIAPMMDE
jgi:hypothetical protein